jgi:uracil permease
MQKESYIYDLDDRLPVPYGILYGLQWAVVTFPFAIISVKICGPALNLSAAGSIRFLQLTLFTTGFFSFLQTLLGHRYPIVEGPSVAVLLSFILLVPFGLPAVQGGMIIGGLLLVGMVLTKQLEKLTRLFTPNVVGVIVMLIAFGLLPSIIRFITNVDSNNPHGEPLSTMISLVLIFFIAALFYWLKGFWQTISTLIGMAVGTLVFLILGRVSGQALFAAPWVSFSMRWLESTPGFYWPAAFAFACSYLAVIVNSLGSLQGIASITDKERLPASIRKGILLNGVSGIVCGLLGVAGTVSFSWSPGLILVNRVASRFLVSYCGIIVMLAAFLPKLAALLALVPSAVVGAVLCVAMGGQIGIAISIITSKAITSRDFFVVGIPVFLGTLVGFLPQGLFDTVPKFSKVFLGNSLIVGIVTVLLLEHVLMRESTASHGKKLKT